MASSNKRQDERTAQHAAADTLQRQIDELVQGVKASPGSRPASFRDFINEKMAEHTAPPKKARSKK
jgi:hypothetical protein